MDKISKTDLLIIDNFGLINLNQHQRLDMMEIIEYPEESTPPHPVCDLYDRKSSCWSYENEEIQFFKE